MMGAHSRMPNDHASALERRTLMTYTEQDRAVPYLIIYHGGCPDGFCSAWVAAKWRRACGSGYELHAATYGEDPPPVAGRHVLIVDFSYPRDTLLEMDRQAASLHVFDHHATAQQDLGGLSFAVFDMDESGASLTWRKLFPEVDVPPVVAYVRDRDLWRWELPESKEVSAYVMSTPHTIEAWDELAKLTTDELIDRGRTSRRVIEAYVASRVRHAYPAGSRRSRVDGYQHADEQRLRRVARADANPREARPGLVRRQRGQGARLSSLGRRLRCRRVRQEIRGRWTQALRRLRCAVLPHGNSFRPVPPRPDGACRMGICGRSEQLIINGLHRARQGRRDRPRHRGC